MRGSKKAEGTEARVGEEATERGGAGWSRLCSFAERRHCRLATELKCEIVPWRRARHLRVPGVADEYRDPRFRDGCKPFAREQIGHSRQGRGVRPSGCEVPQRGERLRLAAAELGDERQHRRRGLGFAGEAARQHQGLPVGIAKNASPVSPI